MSGVIASCMYNTLQNGMEFIIDYFTCIGKEELLSKILMK